MRITINGYKNIENLDYEIIDNKLNVLIGISGSGKSSIIGALKKENIELHKKIGYIGDFYSSIDTIDDINKVSIYSEEYIDRYLFHPSREESIVDVLIDENNQYLDSFKNLEDRIHEIRLVLNDYESIYGEMVDLQRQLGAKLTSTNKIKNTSPIKKIETTLRNLGKSRIYKKISEMEEGKPQWIISGIKFIEDGKCPFCSKRLSTHKNNEILKIGQVDYESKQKLNLSDQQLSILKKEKISITLSSLFEIEEQIISLGIAIQDFEKLTMNVNKLFEDEKTIENLDFSFNEDLYKFFPRLKIEVSKLNKGRDRLNKNAISAFNNTKTMLSRKLNRINDILEKFGIPYKIIAEYKNKRIVNYKIYLIKDELELERTTGLSIGERKLISLIFFVLEQEKKLDNELIIFDDPVSSYDENRRYSLFQFILNSLKGRSVLILSHDQLFAKFATDDNGKRIGKVSYFDNYEDCSIIDIKKENFSDIKGHLRNRILQSTEYIQKVINMRYFYEFSKSYNNQIYSYLSVIIHKENMEDKLLEKRLDENEILLKIKNEFGIDLLAFNEDFYRDIDTRKFSLFEKLFLLREVLEKKSYGEIVNHIHLNSKFAISLNPYEYSFCSNYIYQLAKTHITDIYSM